MVPSKSTGGDLSLKFQLILLNINVNFRLLRSGCLSKKNGNDQGRQEAVNGFSYTFILDYTPARENILTCTKLYS
jgi:hypothetical protein